MISLPTNHNKKMLHCIYLDKDGYIKFYMEYWKGRVEVTKEKAENSWKRMYKHIIDGIEYRQFIDHKDFSLKRECEVARKYGFETVEEIEWIS